MNKYNRSLRLWALALATGSALWLVGCSPSDATIEKTATPASSSRIQILEESSRGENTYTIFRDKTTGREYCHIDGFYSGAVIELRAP
jgi:hypothetical protein